MSSSRIRWTSRALQRLDDIDSCIQKDDPYAAARVVARLVSAVDMLAQQPAAGRSGRIKAPANLCWPISRISLPIVSPTLLRF